MIRVVFCQCWLMYVQVDPGGQVSVHVPPSQLYNSFHLLHQRLVLPMPNVVFLLSHKEEEEGFTQGEEGRQVFHRQLRLEQNIKNKEESLLKKVRLIFGPCLWLNKKPQHFYPQCLEFSQCAPLIHTLEVELAIAKFMVNKGCLYIC